ncbi:4732_t:CDS:2 [Dentiscutata erythropus]|uniref:4732_t:CDS:1 n=1 Tax=Dentiscutata erythropus TaxID=1348616 RepID=A0A9N9ITU0_9GLOM|nr:4732_t:CDS:2 [Dentiscutata erythropus]
MSSLNYHEQTNNLGLFYYMSDPFEQDFSGLEVSNNLEQNQGFRVDLPLVIRNHQAINSKNKRGNLLLVDYNSQSFSSENETDLQNSLSNDESNESFTLLIKKIVDINKQCEWSSATINCQWHINFNNHKGTTKIVCTSFVDSHNHELNSLITQMAPCFRKLTKEMIKDIEFYTYSTEVVNNFTCSRIVAQVLLKDKTQASFEWVLEQLNIATNEITSKTIYSNADPAMDTALQNIWPHTHHSHCIFHMNNNFIKKIKPSWVNNSMNIIDFFVVLGINWLNEEANYARINEQKNTNPTIGLPHVMNKYFSTIDSLIQEYLTLHNKSFPEPDNIIEYSRWYKNNISEDENLIALLLSIRLCESNQNLLPENNNCTINFRYLAQFRVSNVFTPVLKKSVNEKNCWSKGYGRSKKALNLMIRLNCDNEFLQIIEGFILAKTRKLQQIEDKQAIEEEEFDENMIEEQVKVANLFVTKRWGRPPKRFKDALENITNSQNLQNFKSALTNNEPKKRKNKCANCGNYGYNVRTCPT